jgi:hypothetical protein
MDWCRGHPHLVINIYQYCLRGSRPWSRLSLPTRLETFRGVFYPNCVSGGLKRHLKRRGGIVMRGHRVPAIVLFAVALLATVSLRSSWIASAGPRPIGDADPRTPVLVELFTSEGCSSCPPADALLEKLDRSQPVGGAELVVLSEHVDYWNDIGWKDPYSSHQFSVRQGDYARRFRLEGPYTPQMVVDGGIELVGSDGRRAIQAIENSLKTAKLSVILSSIRREGNTLALHVETTPLASWETPAPAEVLIALADNSDQSSVRGGENSGRILKHVAVVRTLTPEGTIDNRGAFSKDATLNMENADPRNLRVIAIVQEMSVGRVLGVGAARVSN